MAEYIEREAVLKKLCARCNEYFPDDPCEPSECYIREWVLEVPAACVEPVVHGRWREADDGDGAVCSVCGEDFCNIYLEVDRFKYCPNCGAHMKDGDGNG